MPEVAFFLQKVVILTGFDLWRKKRTPPPKPGMTATSGEWLFLLISQIQNGATKKSHQESYYTGVSQGSFFIYGFFLQ